MGAPEDAKGRPFNAERDDETVPAGKATRFDSAGNELDEADFYCPGCGRRSDYQRECTGRPEAPHPPIEVVSTDELQGDEHTAAPASE